MKKWMILFGALLAALLLLVYCTEVEFDNPLDKDGTNYLYGKDNIKRDEDKATKDSAGVSGLFDTSRNGQWSCDGDDPELSFVGEQSPEIWSNDQTEFNKLMGKGPQLMAGAVTWKGDNVTLDPAVLERGGGVYSDYSDNKMPEAGVYQIVYTAKKEPCFDYTPITVKRRGLVIKQYTAPELRPPTVTLTGQNLVTVNLGDPYNDLGVVVRDGNGTSVLQLTSIVVTDGNGNPVGINITQITTTEDALTRLNSLLTTQNNKVGTFIITYNVTSPTNQLTGFAKRTVEFKEGSSAGLPLPLIVLNTYRHVYEGKTINHVDTAFAAGGSYREIDVKEVYYMKDGVKVAIPVGNVNKPTVQGSNTPAQRTAVYTLPASANTYQSATATRYVYIWDRDCETSFTAPTITLNGGDPLTLKISDGATWDYRDSWRISGNDDASTATRKYLVDLGGLERLETSGDGSSSNRAVLKTGSYTITYVALGGCGGITVKTRALTVNP